MIQGAGLLSPLGVIQVILTGQSTCNIWPGPLRSWANSGTLPSYYEDLVTCTDTLLTAGLGLSVFLIHHMAMVIAWKLLRAGEDLLDFPEKRIEFVWVPFLLVLVRSPRSAPI